MYDELIARLRNCLTEVNCTGCDCNNSLMKQAADAIEELQKAVVRLEDESGLYDELPTFYIYPTKWIPVTERLPKENGRYLVRYVRDIDGVHSDEVRIMWFADAQWRFPFICNPNVRELVTMEKVTHWMPLPEPPERNGE